MEAAIDRDKLFQMLLLPEYLKASPGSKVPFFAKWHNAGRMRSLFRSLRLTEQPRYKASSTLLVQRADFATSQTDIRERF